MNNLSMLITYIKNFNTNYYLCYNHSINNYIIIKVVIMTVVPAQHTHIGTIGEDTSKKQKGPDFTPFVIRPYTPPLTPSAIDTTSVSITPSTHPSDPESKVLSAFALAAGVAPREEARVLLSFTDRAKQLFKTLFPGLTNDAAVESQLVAITEHTKDPVKGGLPLETALALSSEGEVRVSELVADLTGLFDGVCDEAFEGGQLQAILAIDNLAKRYEKLSKLKVDLAEANKFIQALYYHPSGRTEAMQKMMRRAQDIEGIVAVHLVEMINDDFPIRTVIVDGKKVDSMGCCGARGIHASRKKTLAEENARMSKSFEKALAESGLPEEHFSHFLSRGLLYKGLKHRDPLEDMKCYMQDPKMAISKESGKEELTPATILFHHNHCYIENVPFGSLSFTW
jgi:hypothetical protein